MGGLFFGAAGAINAGATPFALMLGDSWFWYPQGNLPSFISKDKAFRDRAILVIGRNGAEAQEWATKYRKDIDFAFANFARQAGVFILSGGGNDVAGTADFLRILAEDCSKAKTIDECYRFGQPDDIIAAITSAYRQVIGKFRHYNPNAPVMAHNYDNAWPSGDGMFGPSDWLKKPMDLVKVPTKLRRPLFKDLLARLGAAQVAMQSESNLGTFVAIQSAGTMPEDPDQVKQWWANELHPTYDGFKLLARKAFVPAIKNATGIS